MNLILTIGRSRPTQNGEHDAWLKSSAPDTNGIGVSGTGSTYGVYGASSGGSSAGIVGKNGPNGTAPGVYAQTDSPAPGLLAISGLAGLVDALFSTNLDGAAANWGKQYPNKAALFIGDVALTGAIAGATCAFQNASGTAVSGVTSSPAAYGVSAVNNGAWPCVALHATSNNGHGVHGVNGAGSGETPKYGCGVLGDSNQGYGVYGASSTASGVYGVSKSGTCGGVLRERQRISEAHGEQRRGFGQSHG